MYALGDVHLSFSVDKPMDIFDPVWKDHEKKIEKYWRKKITPEDTIVLTGDHSWGRNVKECEADFAFIRDACPDGRFSFGETMTCSGIPRRRSG